MTKYFVSADNINDLQLNELPFNCKVEDENGDLWEYDGKFLEMVKTRSSTFGFHPRNREQLLMQYDIMDPKKLITLVTGKAGTGKNFMTFLTAIHLALKHKKNILYTRDCVDMGRAVGLRPGTLEEKTDGYFRPAKDIIELILTKGNNIDTRKVTSRISLVPLSELRGVTITDTIMIIDEVQNTSIADLQSFITRMGEGSKVVILGSKYQKDDPRLKYSGLEIENILYNTPYFSHVNLIKNERHPVLQEVDDLFFKWRNHHDC